MLSVHSYESLGTFDGPGIRLVVFLQGCPFRCLYCANPDTIATTGGTPTAADEILSMAVDQKPFFGRRGGVTFSGGEPTLQAMALLPLVESLHSHGIHVCIDTNGGVDTPAARRLLLAADLVLLDIKHVDPDAHRALTGRANSVTLDTARFLHSHGRPMWLRHVLVPGLTSSPRHLHALGRELGSLTTVERLEILPYHTLGVHKYAAMGMPYQLPDTPQPTPDQLEDARRILAQYFPSVVVN